MPTLLDDSPTSTEPDFRLDEDVFEEGEWDDACVAWPDGRFVDDQCGWPASYVVRVLCFTCGPRSGPLCTGCALMACECMVRCRHYRDEMLVVSTRPIRRRL